MAKSVQDLHLTVNPAIVRLLDSVLPPSSRNRSGQVEDLILSAAREIIGSKAVSDFLRDPANRIPKFSPRTIGILERGGIVPQLRQPEYWLGRRSSLDIQREELEQSQAPGCS